VDGQVVSKRVERGEGRELGLQVGVAELVDVLGPRQVTEPVRAQVGEPGTVRQTVEDEVVGRL
jgi:hypothetical protein